MKCYITLRGGEPMKNKNSVAISGRFESHENVKNSTFLKTKMRVFAFGENRNGSLFDLDSFTRARDSISLIPVVAKYTEANDSYGNAGDLTGHNVELKETKDGYEFYHDTFPIGVISNTSNFYIEEVNEGTEINPDIKQYVVADEVYLWKRYEATKKIGEWLTNGITPKVSMEIGDVSGTINEDGYFHIDSFEFEAVAVLGSDVEPCFPRSEITTYSKQEFKKELKELVFELNKTLQGGDIVSKEIEKEVEKVEKIEEEIEATVEEIEVVEEVETEKEPETTEEVEDKQDVKEDKEDNAEETKEESEDINFEEKFNDTVAELNDLKEQYDLAMEQIQELSAYKRKREEDDLRNKFEGRLSEEEFKQVFEECKDEGLDTVEQKLFALIGKKNFSLEANVSTGKTDKVKIVQNTKEEYKPYGNLFD